MDEKQIIFIVGLTHSGSSIIARVLNTLEASLNIGELISLNRYAKRDVKCSCGEPISKCTFWQSIPKQDYSFRKRNLINFRRLRKIIKNNRYLYWLIFNTFPQIEIVIDNSKHFLRAVILSFLLKDKYNIVFAAPHRSYRAMYKSLKKRQGNKIKGIDQTYPLLLLVRFPIYKILSPVLKGMVKLQGHEFIDIDMNHLQDFIEQDNFNLTKVGSDEYKIHDFLNHSIGGSRSSRKGRLRV